MTMKLVLAFLLAAPLAARAFCPYTNDPARDMQCRSYEAQEQMQQAQQQQFQQQQLWQMQQQTEQMQQQTNLMRQGARQW